MVVGEINNRCASQGNNEQCLTVESDAQPDQTIVMFLASVMGVHHPVSISEM